MGHLKAVRKKTRVNLRISKMGSLIATVIIKEMFESEGLFSGLTNLFRKGLNAERGALVTEIFIESTA